MTAPILKTSKILQFNPNTVQDVRKGLGLDQLRLNQAIDILQVWIQKQEHFVKKDFSREYLERVLISAKGSTERAKIRLDKLCTLRTILPEFFEKCHVRNDFPKLGDSIRCIRMPKFTPDNCRIYIIQLKRSITSSSILLDSYKFSISLSEYVKLNDYSDGVYVILDIKNISLMETLSHFNLVDARNILSIYTDGYGFRIKAIYIISTSRAIDILNSIIKQLFSAKIAQRVQVIQDIESLYKYLPKHLLPEDYGGEEDSISTIFENWTEELSSDEHVNYMKDKRENCVNERLRKSDKLNEDYIGMPGSFKFLNVD